MAYETTQTQNSILRISDEKTLQLIELYEQEECLWNTLSEDYKCRVKRLRAAERIARALNLKHFESRHVIIKFKNLRNSYCQELKKIASCVMSGASVEDMYRPKVFWFGKMDSFLRPHLQPQRCTFPTVSLNIPETECEERIKPEPHENESVEDWNQQSEDSNLPDSNYPVVEHSFSDSDDFVQKTNENKAIKRAHSCYMPSPKRVKEDDVRSLSQSVRELSGQVAGLRRGQDYFDSFGQYVAALLRAMPRGRALALQPRLVGLLVAGLGDGPGSQPDGQGS